MKKITFLILGSLMILSVQAQTTVMLESAGITTAYNGASPFEDAYTAAVAGDIIYLPGGSFKPPVLIDKSISIIGVGHYPSATTATSPTVLSTNLNIGENADGLFIEGLDLGTYSIEFAESKSVNNVTISRCKMFQLLYNGTGATPSTNNTIKECIITDAVYFTNATDATLSNCIVHKQIKYGASHLIKNNILMYDYRNSGATYGTIFQVDNATISGNIFFRAYSGRVESGCNLCKFYNNVFATNPHIGNNTFENNYNSIGLSTFFENQSGNTFSYDHRYHLSGNNATTYLGKDGTQTGIYGGLYPYKEMAIPSTPHISAQSIAASTDANGLLNVSITVEAQEK